MSFFHREIASAADTRYLGPGSDQRVHRALAAYFRAGADPAADGSWRGLTARSFANLPYHLAQSRQHRQLQSLLADFTWLQAKIEHTDVNAVLEDYEWVEPNAAARRVASALRLSAGALADDPDQLASQLYGRLLLTRDRPGRELLKQISRNVAHVWLRPWNYSLTPVGPSMRTIELGEQCRRIAISPDARRAAVIFEDNGLGIVTLDRVGEVTRSEHRCRKRVRDVTFSTDGQTVFCACADGSVEEWDAQTVRQSATVRGAAAGGRFTAATTGRDGSSLVTGTGAGQLAVYSDQNSEPHLRWHAHQKLIRGISVRRPPAACSVGDDSHVKVWSLATGDELVAEKTRTFGDGPVDRRRRTRGRPAVSDDGKVAITAPRSRCPGTSLLQRPLRQERCPDGMERRPRGGDGNGDRA